MTLTENVIDFNVKLEFWRILTKARDIFCASQGSRVLIQSLVALSRYPSPTSCIRIRSHFIIPVSVQPAVYAWFMFHVYV